MTHANRSPSGSAAASAARVARTIRAGGSLQGVNGRNYDRIARWYDVDMARSMLHDDVGFYRALALRFPGRVLEMGCGNGRILLDLLAAGCEVVGIDRSEAMLRSLHDRAATRNLRAHVARMDVRELGLAPGYSLVLCPYSLITYMTDDADAAALCAGARRVLRRRGALLVDAFVPRPTVASEAFREDYRRACAGGELVRSRRITPLAGGLNRIERRYVLRDASGAAVDNAETVEVIRPYTCEALRRLLAHEGFTVEGEWWDYGARPDAAGAQFVSLLARSRA